MAFRVGQEVVCIEDRPGLFCKRPVDFYRHDLHGLRKGAVYTVRGFYAGPGIVYNANGIYLNEIVRPISSEGVETPFCSLRFRPIVKTDISLLEEIARKVTQGKRVKIDA